MGILAFIILIIAALISLLTGAFLFFNPTFAIELQRRFYEKINWRMEPISVSKEIRNTKIMGLLLAFLSFFAVGYAIIKVIKI